MSETLTFRNDLFTNATPAKSAEELRKIIDPLISGDRETLIKFVQNFETQVIRKSAERKALNLAPIPFRLEFKQIHIVSYKGLVRTPGEKEFTIQTLRKAYHEEVIKYIKNPANIVPILSANGLSPKPTNLTWAEIACLLSGVAQGLYSDIKLSGAESINWSIAFGLVIGASSVKGRNSTKKVEAEELRSIILSRFRGVSFDVDLDKAKEGSSYIKRKVVESGPKINQHEFKVLFDSLSK
jgi:hypothetical protein